MLTTYLQAYIYMSQFDKLRINCNMLLLRPSRSLNYEFFNESSMSKTWVEQLLAKRPYMNGLCLKEGWNPRAYINHISTIYPPCINPFLTKYFYTIY